LQVDFPSNIKARFQIGDAITGYEITGGNVGLTGGRSIEFGGVTGQTATGIIGSVQTDNNNGQLLFSTRGSGTTAERARITNTGNVLINTTTDAGFRLDVNGTARVSGTARIESSLTALSSATIGGTTLAANAIFQVNGSGKYVNYNSSFSSGSFLTYQAYGTWDAIGADSPAGTILAFGGYRASQWTGITFHSNGSERMRIFSTGNLLINTTTDAGFRLDVNGTARINTLTIGLGTGQVSTNTAIGSSALLTNTTGSENTAVGFDALRANTTGQSNVAVGRNAMTSNTTGGNNASFGRFALRNNTTGTANTSLGNSAMNDNTTGGFNIGIGSNSLVTNTSGSNNIGIGANCSSGNFDASIILGRDATATASNQFVVGSTTYNAGSVTTEVNVSTQVWNVVINGVARKILLA
jgi:hypothetical protein